MRLVANRINGTHLRDLLPEISGQIQVDNVLAAIAYGSSASDEVKDLVGHALANKLRLDLWMRYDETVPVSLPFLRRLLINLPNNIFTQFVPDCFHSKVIWWRGYGVYIGSANHTDRGWLTNIEAGVFIDEDELVVSGMDGQLELFFDYLRDLDQSIPISTDYVAEMERLSVLNKDVYSAARKAREHSVWEGPSFVARKAAFDRSKESFKVEWLNTLGILQSIQQQLLDYRPSWVQDDVPLAWQVDQFLHAYYFNRVGDNLRKPYEEYYSNNKGNPNAALKAQLEWWRSLPDAPSNEDVTFYGNAPVVKQLLAKNKVLDLSISEFETLCSKTHATRDHVIKVPMAALGRLEVDSMDRVGRLKLFAPMVLNQKNTKGWDVRQLLHYVLYEGADKDLWERLYHAGRDDEYRIPRYGLNSIGEVIGWARPELVPPRNGRTSKALRALGFDVKIY